MCMRPCLQVNVENLKDRDLWAAGWLQIAELEAGLLQGVPCRACSGKGATSCATCGASGAVLVEVPIGQQTL